MNTLFQTRIDADQKKAAERLFQSMGMTLGSAFKMFIAQSLNDRCLPFKPTATKVPNKELLAAIQEAKEGKGKRFDSVEELMDDLLAEDGE